MFLTMYRGKATIEGVLNMGNREFRTLLNIRSKELENEHAQQAEAGAQLEEEMS